VTILDATPFVPKPPSRWSKLPLWVRLLIALLPAAGVLIKSLFLGLHYLEGGILIWGLGLVAAFVIAILGWALVMHFDEVKRRERE
jgi:hypothetical protein